VTEIFVFGDQNSGSANGSIHYNGIFSARPQLGNGNDIMSRGAQRTDYGEIAALIREEPHWLTSRAFFWCDEKGFFMRDRIRCVSHGGLDIAPGDSRIRIEKFRLGCAFAKFSQQQLHWHSRAANHRFAEHYFGVYFNAIGCGHWFRRHLSSARISIRTVG
jgi:hypothetical protein